MSTTISYGSITIVDITDIGEFSVYPKCNLPTTVIYSPDSGNYTPNWQTNNLVITPVAYYAGTQQSSNITWIWERQEGSTGTRATVVSGTNGETIDSNGVLTVSANKFPNGSTYSQLTYFVTATYPNSASNLGKDLVAEGQITFSKVEQGTSAKIARITGDNIFKYDKNGALTPSGATITLTGTVTNCNITAWQYKNSSGNFVTYPNSGTTSTLTVSPSDAVFVGDKATIKLVTNDNDTYDIFSIYKLYDGAAGTATLTAVLTNEDQMIAANSNGTPISYNGAVSTVRILMGGDDITKDATITITSDNGIGFTSSKSDNTYVSNDTATVNAMTVSSGNVYFQCTGYAQRQDLNADTYVASKFYIKSGNTYTLATGAYNASTTYYEYYDLNKTFSLIKITAGADAQSFTIYELKINALALNKDISNVFTPNSFTASAEQTLVTTTSATTTPFEGKFRITESYNTEGASDSVEYITSNTESSKTYTPSGPAVSRIKVELLDTAGSNVLDTQTVVITANGATGAQGPNGPAGANAISILMGNEAEVIACTNSNYPVAQTTITIPFGAYEGTTRVAATVNRPKLFNISPSNTSTDATASSDGSLVYVIPTSTLISNASGLLNLTFTCRGQSFNKVFSWTRSSAAKNGVDGVTMLLFTPNGTLFDNGEGTVTVEGYLQSGATNVTSSTTWKWFQWLPNSATPPVYDYRELPTTAGTEQNPNYAYYSGKDLTILPQAINGYGSFKVTAVYGGKTYTQYISITDKTDPIQVSVHSTLGTQLVNGQGSGAIYARVTRNEEEIDPIGDTAISTGTSNPTGGNNGDHYIKLNETDKTATLYYKDGGSWKIQPIEATYEWTFRKADNTPINDSTTLAARFGSSYNSTTGKVTGKCIYIDKTTVVNKLTADVMVTLG